MASCSDLSIHPSSLEFHMLWGKVTLVCFSLALKHAIKQKSQAETLHKAMQICKTATTNQHFKGKMRFEKDNLVFS